MCLPPTADTSRVLPHAAHHTDTPDGSTRHQRDQRRRGRHSESTHQHTRGGEPMSGQCWPAVYDGGSNNDPNIGSMSRVCWVTPVFIHYPFAVPLPSTPTHDNAAEIAKMVFLKRVTLIPGIPLVEMPASRPVARPESRSTALNIPNYHNSRITPYHSPRTAEFYI